MKAKEQKYQEAVARCISHINVMSKDRRDKERERCAAMGNRNQVRNRFSIRSNDDQFDHWLKYYKMI